MLEVIKISIFYFTNETPNLKFKDHDLKISLQFNHWIVMKTSVKNAFKVYISKIHLKLP